MIETGQVDASVEDPDYCRVSGPPLSPTYSAAPSEEGARAGVSSQRWPPDLLANPVWQVDSVCRKAVLATRTSPRDVKLQALAREHARQRS
jgi:hypothetical protein